MCNILYASDRAAVKAARVALTQDTHARLWTSNPDGMALAYRSRRWVVKRGLMDEASAWEAISRAFAARPDLLAIHYRYGTSGGRLPDLTHGFPVKAGWLMHNGVLPFKGQANESDTAVLAGLGCGWTYSQWSAILSALDHWTSDRILFLPKDHGKAPLLIGRWQKGAGGVLWSSSIPGTGGTSRRKWPNDFFSPDRSDGTSRDWEVAFRAPSLPPFGIFPEEAD